MNDRGEMHSEGESITVQYRLERDDLISFYSRVLQQSQLSRSGRKSLLWILVLALVFGFLLSRTFSTSTGLFAFWCFYGLSVAWITFKVIRSTSRMPSVLVDQAIKSSSERAILGPIRLTISIAGVRSDAELCTLIQPWAAIDSIESAPNQLVLKTGKLSGHVIPYRAFESAAAIDRFVSAAQTWRQASPSLEANCPRCDYLLRGTVTEGCPECGWRREPASNAKPSP